MRLSEKFRLWFAVLVLVWTLLLVALLFANLREHADSVTSFARSEAEVLIQHMKSARAWNALHGGVYVEVNENTPPNPYLEGLVKERDIVTPEGRRLTLVNPAYMTRLINEYFNETDKRVAHITSLNPIRPENAPDPWERAALQAFEQGAAEVFEITEVEGRPFMRLMRPLTVQQACLQCHASQGYKVGDIRGGITASVPFDEHARYLQELNINDSMAYGAIWLLGLVGLAFASGRLSRRDQALKQAEEFIHILSSSVEQASEAIMITDQHGIIEYINPSFSQLTGYAPEDVIGKTPAMLKSGAHDERFYQAIWRDIASGKAWQGRVVNRKRDGTCYPAMLTVSPIKRADGEVTHFVGSQQDLREYEHLEEQFHQAQKMEALGTLVGGIAHDFNNTLAGISGNAYLAGLAVEGNAEASERLETIETLSFRAAGMIQQLLAFSRSDVRSMNPMLISSFLKETIKMHEVSIPESVRLQNDVFNSDMQVRGDINLLQQVMMNLINNARDAVEGVDEPTITIRLDRFEADAAFRAEYPDVGAEAFARISISDNGCGVRQEDLAHIFDPFFSTKEVGKGTGLGLSMAYGAVRSHGGVLTVESTPGAGATFHICLPLLQADESLMAVRADEEIVAGRGETILLVDDEVSVVETGKAVLERLGYVMLTARNGREALDIYRERGGEIDLLIMDIVMPDMGGLEAAAEMRRINPQAKIIFATGYDRSGSGDRLKSETVIAKPFSAGKISRLIRDVLERHTSA